MDARSTRTKRMVIVLVMLGLGVAGVVMYLVVAVVGLDNILLDRGVQPDPDAPIGPTATSPPLTPGTKELPTGTNKPRDVSRFGMLDPRLEGAMFEYDLPTTEDLLEHGLYAGGASPTHLAIIGNPVADSVRCNWHDSAMTNTQREEALRFLLGIEAGRSMPPATQLQPTLDSYATRIAPQYRDAYQANFNHLVNGGVLDDGQILACYVNYAVSEYLLGSGPSTLIVAYDQIAKSRSYDLYKKAHAAGRYGDDALLTAEQYAATDAATVTAASASINEALMGRSSLVFLAPMAAHSSIAVEAWQAVAQWDVQTIDGVATAVRYGADPNEPEYAQPLAAFKTRVTTAAASDTFAGKRIANVNGLNKYYRDMGAYDDITPGDGQDNPFTPAQPPAACARGRTIPDHMYNPGLVSDCRALLAAKDTLRGTATTLNWSEDIPINRWTDVGAGGHPARVGGLFISELGLNGSIPPELGQLSALTALEIQENQLTGPIPPELGNLSDLDYIALHHNQLTGPIPSTFGNLTKLSWIHLGWNQLSGPLPPELGNLKELHYLNLRYNGFTGPIPSEWGGLTDIQKFLARNNQLSGEIPAEIANWTNLSELDLYTNQLTGPLPRVLGNLDNLTLVNLQYNGLNGPIPPEWRGFSRPDRLQLHVFGNTVTGCNPLHDVAFARSDIYTFGLPACATILTLALSGPETVREGESATYTVSVSGGTSTGDIVVRYSLAGETTAGEDYSAEAGSGSVTIPAGAASATFSVAITDDDVSEPVETFKVSLNSASGGGSGVGVGIGTDSVVTTIAASD